MMTRREVRAAALDAVVRIRAAAIAGGGVIHPPIRLVRNAKLIEDYILTGRVPAEDDF